jgi:hypothetical protein
MMNNLLVQTVISYCLVFVVPLVLPIAFIKLVGLGGLRELVTYEAKDTPLHNLDPRLKVLYPIAMGVLSILLTWKLMLAVFGLSIIPWFWLRPSRAKIRVLTVMVIGPALAGFWSQGLYYLPNPPIHYLYQFPWTIAWLGSPGITTYGMVFGLEQTARVLVTVSTSMLILISTDVGDFTWAFERFGAPPQVGFALTAALRFMPADALPDHARAAGRRAARLRSVQAALVPAYEAAGLREAARPVRGAGDGAVAHQHLARHHDDGHGGRRPRLRCQPQARLAARAPDDRRRRLGVRHPDRPGGRCFRPQPPSYREPRLRMSGPDHVPRSTGRASRRHRPASPISSRKETRCVSTQSCSTTAAP